MGSRANVMYVNAENFLTVNSSSQMRGHTYMYKLYEPRCSSTVRQYFFANRIVNVWNSLPATVNFASVASYIQLCFIMFLLLLANAFFERIN